MIAPIEAGFLARYGAQMRVIAIRLLALFALLLMPFGMTAAPAESAAPHPAAAAMPMDHCPGQQSDKSASDCAMPCSAALPATDLSPVASPTAPRLPVALAVDGSLSGIELEIATPPPKLT